MKTFGAKVLATGIGCVTVACLMPLLCGFLESLQWPELVYAKPTCFLFGLVFGICGAALLIALVMNANDGECSWWKEDKRD